MKIGFIGAGTVAKTIAKHVLAFEHQILLSNSRGPDTLSALVQELGPGASAGTSQQAAEQDRPYRSGHSLVQRAAGPVRGRRLVRPGACRCDEQVRELHAPGARRHLRTHVERDRGRPRTRGGGRQSVQLRYDGLDFRFSPSKSQTALFISGDDAEAKQRVGALIDQIGFCTIDLGSLATGGRLQQVGGPLAGIKLLFSEKMFI